MAPPSANKVQSTLLILVQQRPILHQRAAVLQSYWNEPLEVGRSGGANRPLRRSARRVVMGVRRHRRYSTAFKLQLVEAYPVGERSAKGLAAREARRDLCAPGLHSRCSHEQYG